jgi:transposase
MSVVKFNNYQWEKILAFLKTCPNIYIGQENECRNFLEAVFWITRSGSQWRLLPEKYGNWNSIYKRFARWSQAGIFEKLFEQISNDRDLEYLLIDSTIVRAHACSAGAQKNTALNR